METNEQPDSVLKWLTRLGRVAAIAFAIGFVALCCVPLVFSEIEKSPEFIVILVLVAFVFLCGIACILLFVAREMVLWKRKQWQFSLLSLLLVMTQIALAFAVLRAMLTD